MAIPVPNELRRPHPSVARTREEAKGLRPDEHDGLLHVEGPDVFRLRVSREQLGARFSCSRPSEAELRGLEVAAVTRASYGAKVGAGLGRGEHIYAVSLTEKTEKVPLSEEEGKRRERAHKRLHPRGSYNGPDFKLVPNGRLRLSLPESYGSGRRSTGTRARAAGSSRSSTRS